MMNKKSIISQRELQDLLDSDDELPSKYLSFRYSYINM